MALYCRRGLAKEEEESVLLCGTVVQPLPREPAVLEVPQRPAQPAISLRCRISLDLCCARFCVFSVCACVQSLALRPACVCSR